MLAGRVQVIPAGTRAELENPRDNASFSMLRPFHCLLTINSVTALHPSGHDSATAASRLPLAAQPQRHHASGDVANIMLQFRSQCVRGGASTQRLVTHMLRWRYPRAGLPLGRPAACTRRGGLHAERAACMAAAVRASAAASLFLYSLPRMPWRCMR